MEVLTKPPKKKNQYYLVQNVLTAFFSNTRFRLKTGYDGNYYVIHISYTDGASLERVKNAVKVFDCPANPEINFQGTRVVVKREMSGRIKKQLLNELKSVFKLKNLPKESDRFEPINGTVGNYVDKVFNMRDFD